MKTLLSFLILFGFFAQAANAPVTYDTVTKVASPSALALPAPTAVSDATTALGLVTKQQLDAATNFAQGNFIVRSSGTGTNTTFIQSATNTVALNVHLDGASANSDFTLGNGWWGANVFSLPVPVFQPTALNSQMPFDVESSGWNQASWVDVFAPGYGTRFDGTNWIGLEMRSEPADGYGMFTAKNNNISNHIDLYFGPGVINGGEHVGIGDWSASVHPSNALAFRINLNKQWGHNSFGSGIKHSAHNDANSATIPWKHESSSYLWNYDLGNGIDPGTGFRMRPNSGANVTWDKVSLIGTSTGSINERSTDDSGSDIAASIRAKSLNISTDGGTSYELVLTNSTAKFQASSFYWSIDQYGTSLLPFQLRPLTNVNFSVDSTLGALRLAAFGDGGAPALPIIYQGSSHAFTADSGGSYGLIYSNGVVTANLISASTVGTMISGGLTNAGEVTMQRSLSITTNLSVGGTSTFTKGISVPLIVGNTADDGSSGNFQMTADGSSILVNTSYGGTASLYTRSFGGTKASPSASTTANMGNWNSFFVDSSGSTNSPARISLESAVSQTGSDHGAYIGLYTTPLGSTTRARQVGVSAIGTVIGDAAVTIPHASAALQVSSTTRAFMPPVMTTTQKNAIASPTFGDIVADSTLGRLSFYNGSAWVVMSPRIVVTSTVIFGALTALTAANPTSGTITVTGAAVNDAVILNLPNINSGNTLVSGRVTSTDTVTLYASPLIAQATPSTNSFVIQVVPQN